MYGSFMHLIVACDTLLNLHVKPIVEANSQGVVQQLQNQARKLNGNDNY